MEIDEERKDSTSIQGNLLATQIDFEKLDEIFCLKMMSKLDYIAKHKTGLPKSVTISGNKPGQQGGKGGEWLVNNVSLYWLAGLAIFLANICNKMSKRLGLDPVSDRMNPKIEKKLVCCLFVCFFILIIDKLNQAKLLPVSTLLVMCKISK